LQHVFCDLARNLLNISGSLLEIIVFIIYFRGFPYMTRIFKSLALIAAVFSIAAGANAGVIVSAEATNVFESTVAGATKITFDGANACDGYASCSNLSVVQGNQSGVYAAPYLDSTKYSTVGGGQTSTFNLGAAADYFGLYWGSIDSYNTISFYLGTTLVQSFNGAPVVGLLQDGGQTSWASNRYINFNFVNATFDKVLLISGSNAFETDNHAFRKVSVSEPATLLLIGLGFFGLVAARRFKRA
jgi:hypothetical protein